MPVAQLLRDYNDYFLQTAYIKRLKAGGGYITGVRITPERLQAMERMAAWCQERKLDPRHWLQSLFESRRWIFPPQWNQLTSTKHLAKYPNLPVSKPYQAKIEAERVASQVRRGAAFDVNRDLSPVTEAIKARYLYYQESSRCQSQMRDETMGYHPLSTVCARCPRARECERELRSVAHFDIVALRQGAITLEQAVIQERQHFYERR
jgi:hypothetical protein